MRDGYALAALVSGSIRGGAGSGPHWAARGPSRRNSPALAPLGRRFQRGDGTSVSSDWWDVGGVMEDGDHSRRWVWALPIVALLSLAAAMVAISSPAQAIPSFARQTGQPCGTCHTDFPNLTPYGRLFKLNGYTIGGSRFRTTPFPTSEEDRTKPWWPPISTMAIVGFTHNQTPLGPPPPTILPLSPNDNVIVSPVSFFWGGAITEHIGAFAQVTYNAPGPGGLAAPVGSDPFGHTWTWDNTDLRYANTTRIGGLNVLYGITANNNPTVQDVWNTTPAWIFPQAVSTLGNGFGPGTIIEGAFAAHVVSTGGYLWINDLFYVEATAYHTLDANTQNRLGTDPLGSPGLFDVAPYWRVAFEPHWGRNWLMLGTFGMYAPVHPWLFPNTGTLDTSAQTDKFTDIGVDAQYQYQGDNFWFTLRGSYIREHERLDASSFLFGTNASNDLNSLRLLASLAYGNDNRIVLTAQRFQTWGTPDPVVFGGSPDTSGWIAEIAYIPFVTSTAPWWPWFGARIGLQYTFYDKFNGTSAGASANNTLFLHAWFAM